MDASRKNHREDAFERALKEAFGAQTSPVKIEKARQLYARYRTDDMLARLKGTAAGQSDASGKP
jgi:hypothetical protein